MSQQERLECPTCGREVSGHVPFMGDGSGVRLSHHRIRKGSKTPCPHSGRMDDETFFLTNQQAQALKSEVRP
jgi:hypothetical protein